MSRARARREAARAQDPDRSGPPAPRVYRIEIRAAALRELQKLPEDARRRVVAKIEGLAVDPRSHKVEKLKGTGDDDLYRVRAGEYRIVYGIEDDVLLVKV